MKGEYPPDIQEFLDRRDHFAQEFQRSVYHDAHSYEARRKAIAQMPPILFIDDPKKEPYPLPKQWNRTPMQGQRTRWVGYTSADSARSWVGFVEEYFPATGMVRVRREHSDHHQTLPLEGFEPIWEDSAIGSTSRPAPDWMAAVAILQELARFLPVKQDDPEQEHMRQMALSLMLWSIVILVCGCALGGLAVWIIFK